MVPRFNRCASVSTYEYVHFARIANATPSVQMRASLDKQASMLVLSKAPTLLILVLVATTPFSMVEATSFKMDFLSSGTVRTDPLMFSQEILKNKLAN